MQTKTPTSPRSFSKDGIIADILKEVISAIPPKTKVYVIGGAARNDMYFQLFGKRLPQRDFDLLLVGDFQGFIQNLRKKHGFIYGKIRRKNQVVLKKKLTPKPQSITDYLVLDIDRSDEKSVLKNLREHAAFTINGFAIPLRKYLDRNSAKKVIALPGAIEDLKKKWLQLNPAGYQKHPGNLFACLRFMSVGFKAPSKREVQLLLNELPKLETRRFSKNVKKVFGYVGGEQNAWKLLKKLGITIDVFDQKTVRQASLK